MNSQACLYCNPNLEVFPFDSDGKEPMSLCEIASRDGRRTRYAVPAALAELLPLFDGRTDTEEVLNRFRKESAPDRTAEELKELVDEVFLPLGFLVSDPEEQWQDPRDESSFLLIKVPLLSRRFTEPLAKAVSWAFSKPWLIFGALLFFAAQALFAGYLLPRSDFSVEHLSAGGILALMCLQTLSTFLHEIGHAGAAAHYGCRRLEIGWGLYMIFAVFYTDVSEAWKLPRRQRAVIDAAGMYFEAFFLAAMAGLFWATWHPVFAFAFLFSSMRYAYSLNPFLRLDGYWLMTDLFGLYNLRQVSAKMGRAMLLALIGKKDEYRELRQSLSPKARWALMIYLPLSLVFFAFLFSILFNRLVVQLLTLFPRHLNEFLSVVTSAQAGAGEITGSLFQLLWRILMLAGFGLFLYRYGKRAAKPVKQFSLWAGARCRRLFAQSA